MGTIITSALAYLLLYKYATLFVVSYLAALLVPLPSNTSLLAASAFASQGYLNIYVVILVAFFANVLGDITGFFLARRYGKQVLMKIGFRKIIESVYYSKTEIFIVKHSKIAIFVTRFVGGIGPLVNIVTGFSKDVSLKKFLIFGMMGEFVYVMSLSLSGYFLGSSWQDFTTAGEMVSVVFIFLLVIFVVKKIFFKNK